jgi:hypothetical protein
VEDVAIPSPVPDATAKVDKFVGNLGVEAPFVVFLSTLSPWPFLSDELGIRRVLV